VKQFANPMGVYGDFGQRKFFSSGSLRSQIILLSLLVLAMCLTIVGTLRMQTPQLSRLPVQAAPSPVASVVEAAPAAPEPTTPAPAFGATSEDLQNLINTWTAQNDAGKWGIVVQELGGSGRSASYQSTKPYEPASVFKLFVVTYLLQELSAGRLHPDDVIAGGYTVDSCITKAIEVSDNVCANAYGDNFNGWNKTQKMLNAASLTQLKIGASPQTITAQGVGQYFAKLHNGQMLDKASTQRLIGHLQHTIYRKGIPKGCIGCTVANKVGDNPDALNDVALIDHNGIIYSLVILSNRGTYAQIADLAAQVDALLLKPKSSTTTL
jgi:beta-lactamase class A